jgi:hypothetical protein
VFQAGKPKSSIEYGRLGLVTGSRQPDRRSPTLALLGHSATDLPGEAPACVASGLWAQDSSPGRAHVVREVLDASAVLVLLLPVASSGQRAPDSPYVSSSRT